MDPKVLDIDTRKEIFELVKKFPGLHMREIARRLDMQLSLVEYHINYLTSESVIYSIQENRYRRFYVDEDFDDKSSRLTSDEKRMLHLLRQDIPLKIVSLLLHNPKAVHKEILKEVDVSASTLSYHLGKMKKAGLLTKVRQGKDKGYRLNDRKSVLRVLILGRVKPPSQVENFVDMWEELF